MILHRIIEWFGLEGTLKIMQFQPPWHGQGTPSTRPGCMETISLHTWSN